MCRYSVVVATLDLALICPLVFVSNRLGCALAELEPEFVNKLVEGVSSLAFGDDIMTKYAEDLVV